MRRVVITGMGINSCLGNDLDTVSSALREGRSGITALPDHAEAGLRSQGRWRGGAGSGQPDRP